VTCAWDLDGDGGFGEAGITPSYTAVDGPTFHGGGDDILFGGTTTYYNESTGALDRAALDTILQKWNQTASYATRVARLGAWINATKFTDDEAALDELYGEGDLDWFLTKTGDTVHDSTAGETTTPL
jgi:hypothetical protein